MEVHFDYPAGIGSEELKVSYLYGMLATNPPNDARHRVGMTAAVKRRAGILQVRTVQCRGKPVRVAFAPDLAIRDDVESRAFLIADGQNGRVILRFPEELWRNAPQLAFSRAGWETACKFFAVDKPFRLRIRAYR